MTTFTVGTHNLLKGTALVRGIAPVIGWQEANTIGVHDRINALPGYDTFTPPGALDAIPISWRTDTYELIDTGSTVIVDEDGHPIGKAEVTPFRGYSWVLLKHRKTGALIRFVNTHFVSGAWSAPRPTTAWRRAFWNCHLAKLSDAIRTFLEAPHAVVLVGDMNRGDWITVPGLHHATATGRRAPYDQIHTTLPISAAKRGPKYGSDHYSWTATATLPTPPKEPTVANVYSRADAKTQWFADTHPGTHLTLAADTCVVCLHTTETTGWPPYGGGATAPNDTARPDIPRKGMFWRAHFPDDMSSRALQNDPGGVETNKLNVVQVELVGTCDPKHRRSWNGEGKLLAGRDYIYWPDAPDWALREVGLFLADQHKRHGLQLIGPKRGFKAYPGSYGESNGVRMTFAEWRAFVGVCGHQHVPENDHGDPGDIDIDRILEHARTAAGVVTPKPPAVRKTPLITAFLAASTTTERRELAQKIIDGPNEPAGTQAAAWLKAISQAAAAKAALEKMEVK